MKTKVVAFLCLFVGVGTSIVFAQLPPEIPEGTRCIKTDFFYPGWTEYVTCNGVNDILAGDITLQETDLWKDGEFVIGINHAVKGKLVSQITGEVFDMHSSCKGYAPLDEYGNCTSGIWRTLIVGDKGKRYLVTGSFYQDGTATIDKLSCSEGNKK